MSRIFVMADPHGAYRAVKQVFEISNFDKENDRLILLGDVCDGWTETKQLVDLLLEVKNLDLILGNHDLWALEWMNSGYTPKIWTSQGGFNTIKSYIPTIENVPQVILDSTEVPESHIQFFKNSKLYLEEEIEGKICVFVHGGYDYTKRIEETELNDLLWDRELFSKALEKQKIAIRQNNDPNNFDFYDEIYIGHTTTTWISQDRKNHFYGIDGTYPVKMCNVWAMDQGAGWEGYLTMMDILTKEVYRSDKVSKLYPEEKGRD